MRSKSLLVSNIMAGVYTAGLLWLVISAICVAVTLDSGELYAISALWKLAFDMMGTGTDVLTIMQVVIGLLCVNLAFFGIGGLFGWIAFAAKKSGIAKFAATLYLLGTILFPIFLLLELPIIILGFVGGSNQKKINKAVAQAKAVAAQ